MHGGRCVWGDTALEGSMSDVMSLYVPLHTHNAHNAMSWISVCARLGLHILMEYHRILHPYMPACLLYVSINEQIWDPSYVPGVGSMLPLSVYVRWVRISLDIASMLTYISFWIGLKLIQGPLWLTRGTSPCRS